jgi:ABC-type transport system involved in cytochrome c biogenesis ATPase subunit
LIEVENVAKAFGRRRDVRAVDGVSFTAADGEITGLLGPNGAGKTTLLRMLATLMIPDSGNARVDGKDVVRERYGVRRRIGVLSDARGIYPRLTARENIRYFGALQGLPAQRPSARRRLIRALSIADIADRRAHGFSQGERMKVAIARARPRSADDPARRAHQRPRHHEHPAARPPSRSRGAGQVPALQPHVMRGVGCAGGSSSSAAAMSRSAPPPSFLALRRGNARGCVRAPLGSGEGPPRDTDARAAIRRQRASLRSHARKRSTSSATGARSW